MYTKRHIVLSAAGRVMLCISFMLALAVAVGGSAVAGVAITGGNPRDLLGFAWGLPALIGLIYCLQTGGLAAEVASDAPGSRAAGVTTAVAITGVAAILGAAVSLLYGVAVGAFT